jgi:hypothetical protein
VRRGFFAAGVLAATFEELLAAAGAWPADGTTIAVIAARMPSEAKIRCCI